MKRLGAGLLLTAFAAAAFGLGGSFIGGTLGTTHVQFPTGGYVPSGAPVTPASPPARHQQNDYSPRERARSDTGGGYGGGSGGAGAQVEFPDLITPLTELFGAVVDGAVGAADWATRPLRDTVKRIIDSRRRAKAKREADARVIAGWKALEARRVTGLRGRLTTPAPTALPKHKNLRRCPRGQVAVASAPEPPGGVPPRPAQPDPAKAAQLEKCAKIERAITTACGDDVACEHKQIRSRRYFESGCSDKWARLDGGAPGTPGIPTIATRKPGYWCLPERAATRANVRRLAAMHRANRPPTTKAEREAMLARASGIIGRYVDLIRKHFPGAVVFIRGSLATGKKFKTGQPFTKLDFDVDAGIFHPGLAARFKKIIGRNGRVLGKYSNSTSAGRMLNRLTKRLNLELRKEFPQMRGKFSFRIFNNKEYTQWVKPGGHVVVEGGRK